LESRQHVDEQARRSTAISALVRVAAHHGLTLDPQQLIRANPFNSDEPNRAFLLKMARGAGLTGRIMRVNRGELATLARLTPAIALLPNGKAALIVSVQQVHGASFALIDELGFDREVNVLYDEPRLFEFWTGDVIVFRLPWHAAGGERPFGAGWLLHQVVLERKLLRDICIAAFFMAVLSIAPALLFMVMIDRVLVNHSFTTLGVLGIGLLGIVVFDTVFGYLRRELIWLTSSRIDARINIYIFDKLLNLPMSFFERTATGLVNSKLSQIWHIRAFMTTQLFGDLLDASVTLVVMIPLLILLNWVLALGVIGLALVMLGIYVAFLPALRRTHSEVTRAEQNMATHQVETIHGIRTVKSLALDGLKRHQRDLRVAELTEAHQKFEKLANIPQTLIHPLERTIYCGSFFVGCYMAMSDSSSTASMGSVVAFAMLASRVASPIVQLANMINGSEEARGAISEVASVVNVPPEGGRTGTGLRLPITGEVIFQDVRFRYNPGSPYALDGVSFVIPRRTIFGVMGRSGSGKTTVTRLLQGLNRDYEGLVKVDGMDLREIDLDHLRSNIGVVPQENFLFSGTIRDNISAARPKASFDKIVRAAQLAGAEEFIERMPHGYDTAVEEGAVNLSGGQRQRIAIARALLVDPPILILDEATSALDAESEAIVNANLLRIAESRTVIIISHRLSALAMADAILVLERGKFYDVGTHQHLLAKCDIYRMLWLQQNRHLALESENAGAEIEAKRTF
jgi:ATP-binding cassette subfamily B protein